MSKLLELESVDAFYGKSHILQNVSLAVDAGEVVSLLGRNGSGRSTTLKSIMGLVAVRHGDIRFNGASITGRTPFHLAQLGIAFVPEDRRIFPNLTVGENLRLASLAGRNGPWNEARIYEYFAVLGERKDKPAKLSGGEQQMLAIARALMGRPKFLMLDEPSLGIAPRLIGTIFEKIVEINRDHGITILLVEQNANLALEVSRYAYVLETGHIAMSGPSAELRANPQLKAAYLGA